MTSDPMTRGQVSLTPCKPTLECARLSASPTNRNILPHGPDLQTRRGVFSPSGVSVASTSHVAVSRATTRVCEDGERSGWGRAHSAFGVVQQLFILALTARSRKVW